MSPSRSFVSKAEREALGWTLDVEFVLSACLCDHACMHWQHMLGPRSPWGQARMIRSPGARTRSQGSGPTSVGGPPCAHGNAMVKARPD